MNIWNEIYHNRDRNVLTYRVMPEYGLTYSRTCEDEIPDNSIYDKHSSSDFWFDRYDVKVSSEHSVDYYFDFLEKLCYTHSYPQRHCTLHISNQLGDWLEFNKSVYDIEYYWTILDSFLKSLHPDSFCFIQIHNKVDSYNGSLFDNEMKKLENFLLKNNQVLEFRFGQEDHNYNNIIGDYEPGEYHILREHKRIDS